MPFNKTGPALQRDRLILLLSCALILIGLVASAGILRERYLIERTNRTVELTLNFDGAEGQTSMKKYPLERLLADYKAAGVTSVALSELTTARLKARGQIQVYGGNELLEEADTRALVRSEPVLLGYLNEGKLTLSWTYIFVRSEAEARRLHDLLRSRLPSREFALRAIKSGYLIQINSHRSWVDKVGLGLEPDQVRLVRSAGLNVNPRFMNYPTVTPEAIARAFEGVPGSTAFIPAGGEVFGFPKFLPETARQLEKRDMVLALTETPEQLGFISQSGSYPILDLVAPRAVRMIRLNIKELETPSLRMDRWILPVKERNIRLFYLNPYLWTTEEAEIGIHLRYVADLKSALESHGYPVGVARAFGPLDVPPWRAWLIALGVAGGGVLLVRELLPATGFWQERWRNGWQWAVLAVAVVSTLPILAGAIGVSGTPVLTPLATLARDVFAFGSAVIFPALALIWFMKRARGRWAGGQRPTTPLLLARFVADLLLTTAVSLVGAALIAAILGDTRHLLEIEYFRGVKAVHIVPLALVALGYLTIWGTWSRTELRRYLTLKNTIMFLLILAVGFIYISRTGHVQGVGVLGYEVKVREFLEETLGTRPRSKEFLIGHPALALTIWAAVRGKWPLVLPFSTLATIGQISLVNSFEHLRTPLWVSAWRTANGLVLGILLGVGLLSLLDLALHRPRKAPK